MKKNILISGIQPSGKLHLGNYLGALKNFVDLQNSGNYECFFFIADLHSLTENLEPEHLNDNIKNLVREFVAAGLDPDKSNVFQQSEISEHSELMYILTSISPEGDLRRMTQYKDKVLIKKYESNVGLLVYPIMMASDILLYNAKYVPVGDDQKQHLELTRRLARKFNKKYGKTFLEPKGLLTEVSRVMSLDNPSSKMSKSSPKGCLFLSDTEKEIRNKFKKAVTDSDNKIKYDEKKKPAISNLIKIYSEISGAKIKKTEDDFKNASYAELKDSIADLLVKRFEPFRENNISDKDIEKILKKGNEKAKKVASKKLEEVKKKIGLKI